MKIKRLIKICKVKKKNFSGFVFFLSHIYVIFSVKNSNEKNVYIIKKKQKGFFIFYHKTVYFEVKRI